MQRCRSQIERTGVVVLAGSMQVTLSQKLDRGAARGASQQVPHVSILRGNASRPLNSLLAPYPPAPALLHYFQFRHERSSAPSDRLAAMAESAGGKLPPCQQALAVAVAAGSPCVAALSGAEQKAALQELSTGAALLFCCHVVRRALECTLAALQPARQPV